MALEPDATRSRSFVALVLAGRRAVPDALASASGTSHKALLPVAGVPMLERVVRTLRAVRGVERILVSSDDANVLSAAGAPSDLGFHRSRSTPSASVLDCLAQLEHDDLLLVTTADHPLLTPSMVDHFCAQARDSTAEVLVAVVEERVLRASFPDNRRTFIPLRGERVTGANLFALRGPGAVRAAAFWQHVEARRKHPWRLAGAFGARTLWHFALRRLDLGAALARVSETVGARVEAVRMPFAECAIDVDRPEDLELVQSLLAARNA